MFAVVRSTRIRGSRFNRLPLLMPMKPLIIAHRGASADAPENTLAAFALAVAQGADMIELDLQRSADGVLVVFHDDTTERWDGATRPLTDYTLAELRRLTIGGERIATFAETCAFARRTKIALNVELKLPGLAAAAATLIYAYDLAERVLVSSFYAPELRAMRRVAPQLPRAYLMGNDTWRPDVRLRELWPFFALRREAVVAWHPSWALPFARQLIPLVRRAGYQVNVWTVDDPALMRSLVACGATGIITNRPAVARAGVGR